MRVQVPSRPPIRSSGGLGFLSLRSLKLYLMRVLKLVAFSRPHDVKAAVGGTTKGRRVHASLFVIPCGIFTVIGGHLEGVCYRAGSC